MLNAQKEYGVVYTPEWIVDLILDNIMQYYDASKRICDPACGEGAFLVRTVERVCEELPESEWSQAFENIVGFDIDSDALYRCRLLLDQAVKDAGSSIKIYWNLHCIDSTDRKSLVPHNGRFDYVIGNPPYVRIQHLGKSRRERLTKDWELVRHGSTDLYIAFFEIGMYLLKDGGVLGYITPNTYAKTDAGQALRKFILQNHGVECLIDFGSQQIFKGVTTYSLITVISKNIKRQQYKLKRGKDSFVMHIDNLPEDGIWMLQSEDVLHRIQEIKTRGRPLKSFADIHVGIQTLADKVFILEKQDEHHGVICAVDEFGNEVKVETAITRPILKASVMKNGVDVKDRIIIFPYEYGKLIDEKTLREKFPMAYKHLTKNKEILLGRDKGEFDATRWYAFGREFGLTTTFGEKLLTSGMNKKPNFQKCDAPEYTFYSGYCVKPKSFVSIDRLLDELNSDDMEFYMRHTSRDYQSGWKSYAKSFIQDYGVPLTVVDDVGDSVISP